MLTDYLNEKVAFKKMIGMDKYNQPIYEEKEDISVYKKDLKEIKRDYFRQKEVVLKKAYFSIEKVQVMDLVDSNLILKVRELKDINNKIIGYESFA